MRGKYAVASAQHYQQGLRNKQLFCRVDARFESLTALTIDSSGNLYVVDSNTIRKINPAGLVTTIVGKKSSQGISLESLMGSRGGITGIAIDANDVLYVSTRKGVLRIKQKS